MNREWRYSGTNRYYSIGFIVSRISTPQIRWWSLIIKITNEMKVRTMCLYLPILHCVQYWIIFFLTCYLKTDHTKQERSWRLKMKLWKQQVSILNVMNNYLKIMERRSLVKYLLIKEIIYQLVGDRNILEKQMRILMKRLNLVTDSSIISNESLVITIYGQNVNILSQISCNKKG